jgi:hypothetical protein
MPGAHNAAVSQVPLGQGRPIVGALSAQRSHLSTAPAQNNGLCSTYCSQRFLSFLFLRKTVAEMLSTFSYMPLHHDEKEAKKCCTSKINLRLYEINF